jgi:hypothetical protein
MKAGMESFRHIMEVVGTSVDGVGVFIVAGGMLVATARLAVHRAHATGNYYSLYRQDVGVRFCSVSSSSLPVTSSAPSLSRRQCKTCSSWE